VTSARPLSTTPEILSSALRAGQTGRVVVSSVSTSMMSPDAMRRAGLGLGPVVADGAVAASPRAGAFFSPGRRGCCQGGKAAHDMRTAANLFMVAPAHSTTGHVIVSTTPARTNLPAESDVFTPCSAGLQPAVRDGGPEVRSTPESRRFSGGRTERPGYVAAADVELQSRKVKLPGRIVPRH